MPSNATPVVTYVAAMHNGAFVSHGQSLTVTFNITGAWEIQIPVRTVYGANVSLETGVFVYPVMDGGTNYDTDPLTAFTITKASSSTKQVSVRLTTGQYALEVRASSPSVTCAVLTSLLITGVYAA